MKSDRRIPLTTLVALVAVVALSACTTPASDDQSDSTLGTIQSAEPTTTAEPDATDGDGATAESSQESSGSDSSSGSNSSDSSGSTGGNASSPAPTSPPSNAATPPPAATPTAAVTNQKCQSGKLTVSLTASIDNSYRKGIKSVLLERQNEYNAWLDYDASWLGPETGRGDVWQGQLVGNQQNIGKTLRVTVTSTSKSVLTFTTPITANC